VERGSSHVFQPSCFHGKHLIWTNVRGPCNQDDPELSHQERPPYTIIPFRKHYEIIIANIVPADHRMARGRGTTMFPFPTCSTFNGSGVTGPASICDF
jgi:hypothetical protein